MKGTTKVLIGAAFGGMLGVLFAPNKGRKTRKKIKAISKKLKKRFGNSAQSSTEDTMKPSPVNE